MAVNNLFGLLPQTDPPQGVIASFPGPERSGSCNFLAHDAVTAVTTVASHDDILAGSPARLRRGSLRGWGCPAGGSRLTSRRLASPRGEIGRRNGLKIRFPTGSGGSSPPAGTNLAEACPCPLSAQVRRPCAPLRPWTLPAILGLLRRPEFGRRRALISRNEDKEDGQGP